MGTSQHRMERYNESRLACVGWRSFVQPKTHIRPLLMTQQRRRVARRVVRSGLAMGNYNYKSDWGFSASSLDLAETSDHFALRICAVDLKNEPFD